MLHFVFVIVHSPNLSNSQCLKDFPPIYGFIVLSTFRFTPFIWFAPKSASDGNPAKPANVFLDGVSLDKTTDINPIIYGEEESRIDRFAHGIYSLNGQLISNSSSLDDLPSGIYILNGKKVIKR